MNEIIRFELIPEKPPKITKKGSRYDIIIDRFLKSEMNSARVASEDMKARELAIALRSRVRSRELMDKIKVSQRGEKLYLLKMEE